MLKSSLRIQNLVELSVQYKMPALGITDFWNLSGAFEFSEIAIKSGIQPIIGCEIEFECCGGVNSTKVALLTKNDTGFRNLTRMIYESTLNKKKTGKPFHLSNLSKYKDGLILLSGFKGGLIERYMGDNCSVIDGIFDEFGGNAYIELQVGDKYLRKSSIDYAYKNGVPLVATNSIRFANNACNDFIECDALYCIATSTYLSEKNKRDLNRTDYFTPPDEMISLFKDVPEAIENTVNIAKRCLFFVKGRQPILPKFPCVMSKTEEEELRIYARDGLTKKINSGVLSADLYVYQERLEYELNVINGMKFAGYFLIVSDFVRWAKNNGVSVGPGRGSGAGSVVAWVLSITDLDPVRFGLMFERFLNPERVSLPDFDIDFCQELRFRVVEYVMQKYENMAHIITFGKLQAKAVLRDVGRVLQIPYSQVDKICKMIPFNPVNPVTLAQAVEMDSNLKMERAKNENLKQLFDISFSLEGLCRHSSVHAAGIVISDKPLHEYIPVYYDDHTDLPVTQYNMKYTEKSGLVKFDFLGLKTLTLIDKTLSFVKASGVAIDIVLIPLDDKKSYELISCGDTLGVFQLESSGVKEVLVKLRPDCIEDIIAVISLYRPGPMDNIPMYIERKHGLQQIDTIHPLLANVLKETFGVIVYQEQVMEIARVLSGYTLGKADLLRRAMGKKIKSEMDEQREIFVEGAVNNGVERQKAESIFELVEKFAGYGFNKSHAAAYAVIAYRTAYLKAHYRVEFFAALMNLDIHDKEKLGEVFYSARNSGIKVLPPDINTSDVFFSIENNCIRYGLAALKNVGIKQAQYIVDKRYAIGEFCNITSFMNATSDSNGLINKKTLEAIIKSGALSRIHKNQKQLLNSLEMLVSRYCGAKESVQQYSMFSDEIILIDECVDDFSFNEKLDYEFSILGFYLSGHPLSKYEEILKKLKIFSEGQEKPSLLIGVVVSSKMRSSAKSRFAIINLSCINGTYEFAIYDRSLVEKSDIFADRSIICVKLEDVGNGDNARLIAKEISYLDDILQRLKGEIRVFMKDKSKNIDKINSLVISNTANKGLLLIISHEVQGNYIVEINTNRRIVLSLNVLDFLLAVEGIDLDFRIFGNIT